MQASLWKESKRSVSLKCFPKSLITFYNIRTEILMFRFSWQNRFLASFAPKRQTGCSEPLGQPGRGGVAAPRRLAALCRRGWGSARAGTCTGWEGCQGIFSFRSGCLANDLQLQRNTAMIQGHIFFHILIKELMYSSSQCIDYIFHLQILLQIG